MAITYDEVQGMSMEALIWELRHGEDAFEVAQMIRDIHCEGVRHFPLPVLHEAQRYVDLFEAAV